MSRFFKEKKKCNSHCTEEKLNNLATECSGIENQATKKAPTGVSD